MTVEELLDEIRPLAGFLSGVTVSGGEATGQPDFLHQFFQSLADDEVLGRLTRFVDSNGDTDLKTWTHLNPVMDSTMIDLKALDPDLHLMLAGRPNDRVLASIEHLAGIGKLYEVRLLLIPGVNDSPDLLARTADWLLALDPAMRVRLNAFNRHGVRRQGRAWPDATPATIDAARAVLTDAGVLTILTTLPGAVAEPCEATDAG